jgi:hypothetical protein
VLVIRGRANSNYRTSFNKIYSGEVGGGVSSKGGGRGSCH